MNRSPAVPTHRLSNGTGESTSCSISLGPTAVPPPCAIAIARRSRRKYGLVSRPHENHLG